MIKINESSKFRKFNKYDRYKYPEAVGSDDGKYPQIAEVSNGYSIIIDLAEGPSRGKYMVSVYTPSDREYYEIFPNEKAASKVANDLANDFAKYLPDIVKTWATIG